MLDKMENRNICASYILRFLAWIYFGFKEFSYQLWGGQPYDTLEALEKALNSNLVRYSIVCYHHNCLTSNHFLQLIAL